MEKRKAIRAGWLANLLFEFPSEFIQEANMKAQALAFRRFLEFVIESD